VVPPVTPAWGDTYLKRSNRLVLLIGIFLAIVAFVLVVLTIGQPKTPDGTSDPNLREVAIVIAAKDFPLGTKIQADDLTTKNVIERDKPVDSFTDVASVIGQTARADVTSGQLITSVVLGTGSGTGLTHIDCPVGFVCIFLLSLCKSSARFLRPWTRPAPW